jgi:hypothetical protein
MKHRYLTLTAITLLLIGPVASATTFTMEELDEGAGFFIGGLVFYNWSFDGLASGADPKIVRVESLETDPMNPGFTVNGNGQLFADNEQDMKFSFEIAMITGSPVIKGAALELLEFTQVLPGEIVLLLTENVTEAQVGGEDGDFELRVSQGDPEAINNTQDSGNLALPVPSLSLDATVNLERGNDEEGIAQVDSYTIRFNLKSEPPEPPQSDDKDIDVTGVNDISGDAVPDVAYLSYSGQPEVRYYSGADRKQLKAETYLGSGWLAVAAATVADANSNGVANDPAVAVLATKPSAGKHAVEVRRADTGALINQILFMSASWEMIDVAVIDDSNGDGVTGDTAIAVLGFDDQQPDDKQIKVQVRNLSDGAVLGNWFFLNNKWTPLALEGVNRTGQPPLLAVLANKPSSGNNSIQARRLSDGSLQRDTTFWDPSWLARDVAILKDSDGDGNANDPGYVVLAGDAGNRNKVQGKRVSDGVNLKNVSMFSTSWEAKRLTTTGDLSGNLVEEVGAMGEKSTDGTLSIQLKDYDDKTVTGTINP